MTPLKTDAQRARWLAFVAQQPLPLSVECKPYKATRTNEQNRYLFGVAYPVLGEAMGYCVEDIHEYMCGRAFGWVDKACPKTPRNPEGVCSAPFRTTTRDEAGRRSVLDKKQFSAFVETVFEVAAQAGVFIPPPEE